MQPLYSIGALSQRSGLSVKTIRFYSDQGLLPPVEVAPSGYRYFDDHSLLRLNLIRTLREADFSLDTIGQVLDHAADLPRILALQLQTVETQLAALERQRVVLQTALHQQMDLSALGPLMQMARMSAQERHLLLSSHLQASFAGLQSDPTWWPRFWADAALELPERPSQQQLQAWLELAQLAADAGFQQAMQQQSRPFLQQHTSGPDLEDTTRAMGVLYGQAIELARAAVPPDSGTAQALILQFSTLCAHALNRRCDRSFLEWWQQHLRQTADPRVARYWHLVAVLRNEPVPDIYLGLNWVLQGLEALQTKENLP